MKIYLASSFSLISLVKEVAEKLEKHGFEITRKWWTFDFKTIQIPDDEWYGLLEVKKCCVDNFKAIEKADCLILVANPKVPQKFNGANIELGYALALGKPCYSVGKLERSAMYVPVIKCRDLNEVLRRLESG